MSTTFERIDLDQYDGHTPGPWAWHGNTRYNGFYLSTTHSGRIFVMTFDRMGMSGAQPSFQVGNVMVKGEELCRYEVAPDVVGKTAARKPGSGVYREEIIGFDHADAALIAAAPDLLAALRAAYAEIDRLASDVEFWRQQQIDACVEANGLAIQCEQQEAEIDRLRASALEWVTVTDDPTTLPAVGRRVIVEHRNSGMTFAAQIDGPDLWALGSFDGERDTYAILSPGDRWAYIPNPDEVPA